MRQHLCGEVMWHSKPLRAHDFIHLSVCGPCIDLGKKPFFRKCLLCLRIELGTLACEASPAQSFELLGERGFYRLTPIGEPVLGDHLVQFVEDL